jgi:hypothetical protein
VCRAYTQPQARILECVTRLKLWRATSVRMSFHGVVQTTVRSSPTHGLARRLVRLLRLHRATLCRFSCLTPEGCRPDPAGFSRPYSRAFCATRSIGASIYRQRLIRPQPHSRHSSQHPAPSWVSARRSSILRATQLHIRHIVPWPTLRASSELVLPSTSRPSQQTCPSACPCPGSSPITRCVAIHADPGAI